MKWHRTDENNRENGMLRSVLKWKLFAWEGKLKKIKKGRKNKPQN